jgi:ankyrin repeat protein
MFDGIYSDSVTDVTRAVQDNNMARLKELIDQGRSIRHHDNRGMMPLHVAVSLGHRGCVGLLLDKGTRRGR